MGESQGRLPDAVALMEGFAKHLAPRSTVTRDREQVSALYDVSGKTLLLAYDPTRGLRATLSVGSTDVAHKSFDTLPRNAGALYARLFGTLDDVIPGAFDAVFRMDEPRPFLYAQPDDIAAMLKAFGRDQWERRVITSYGFLPAKVLATTAARERRQLPKHISGSEVVASYIRRKNGHESSAMEVRAYPGLEVEKGGVQASVKCYRTRDLKNQHLEHRPHLTTPMNNKIFKMPLTVDALVLVAKGCFDPPTVGELERALDAWQRTF